MIFCFVRKRERNPMIAMLPPMRSKKQAVRRTDTETAVLRVQYRRFVFIAFLLDPARRYGALTCICMSQRCGTHRASK